MTAGKNSWLFHGETEVFIFSRTPKDLAIIQGQVFKENLLVQAVSGRKFSLPRFNQCYTNHTTKTTVAVQLQ